MNKVKVSFIAILLSLVSWNSVFAQDVNRLQINAYNDYNSDNVQQFWESYIKADDGYYVLQEYMNRQANGNCPAYNRDVTEKIFQLLDNDPDTFLQVRTDRCYWFTYQDKDFQQMRDSNTFDIKVDLRNVSPQPFVVKGGFDSVRTFLPFIS